MTDLEIGAVDELLVGVSVARDKDMGGNSLFGISLQLSDSPLYYDQ